MDLLGVLTARLGLPVVTNGARSTVHLLCRKVRFARHRGMIHEANMDTRPVTIRVTGPGERPAGAFDGHPREPPALSVIQYRARVRYF